MHSEVKSLHNVAFYQQTVTGGLRTIIRLSQDIYHYTNATVSCVATFICIEVLVQLYQSGQYIVLTRVISFPVSL